MMFFRDYFYRVLKHRSRLIYALCCRSDTDLTIQYFTDFFFFHIRISCMSFMIYLDILYFGKFMLAFVPKMVRCE